MNLDGYLFTMNHNAGSPLSSEELQDLCQDLAIHFQTHSLNDFYQKKTALREWQKACKIKAKRDSAHRDSSYIDNVGEGPQDWQIAEERRNALKRMNVSSADKKILELLIDGHSYDEIRKRVKLTPGSFRVRMVLIKKKLIQQKTPA